MITGWIALSGASLRESISKSTAASMTATRTRTRTNLDVPGMDASSETVPVTSFYLTLDLK
jgi:hypothetical protein